ncbi:MAG: dihydroneopterin aldolase [Alphaproteobacteria bacterium]
MEEEYSKILINGLTIEMSAGIYDFEKDKKQRVIFDLEITVKNSQSPQNINDVVSYETICTNIENLCQSQHYDLLETLAEDIYTKCLSDDKILHTELIIKKPDIIKNTESVGIKLARKNLAH